MAQGKNRKLQMQLKKARKEKQMNSPSGTSKYALKVKARKGL